MILAAKTDGAVFAPLASKRLQMVRTTVDHSEDLFRIHGDAASGRFSLLDRCLDLEDCRALVARMISIEESGNGFRWSMMHRGYGRVIGSVGLHAWDRFGREAKISFETAPEVRRRGFAFEAVAAVLGFGFGAMGLERILAQAHPRNLPSVRLLGRLGFRRTGLISRHWQGAELQAAVFCLTSPCFVSRPGVAPV